MAYVNMSGVEGWRPSFTNPPNMSWTELNINQKDHEQSEREKEKEKKRPSKVTYSRNKFLLLNKSRKDRKTRNLYTTELKRRSRTKKVGQAESQMCASFPLPQARIDCFSQPHGNTFQKHNRIEDLSQY